MDCRLIVDLAQKFEVFFPKPEVVSPMSKFQCPKSSEFGFWTLYYGLRTSDGGGGEGVVGTLWFVELTDYRSGHYM